MFGYLYATYVNNWVLFPALCAGLFAGFHRAHRRLSTAFLVWLVLCSLFLAFFSSRLRDHWYYADLALPPLAYFTAQGLLAACRLLSRPDARRTSFYGLLGLFVLLALATTPLFGSAAHGAFRPLVLALDIAVVPRWTVPANLQLLALVLGATARSGSCRRARASSSRASRSARSRWGALPRGAGDALASLTERSGTEVGYRPLP